MKLKTPAIVELKPKLSDEKNVEAVFETNYDHGNQNTTCSPHTF